MTLRDFFTYVFKYVNTICRSLTRSRLKIREIQLTWLEIKEAKSHRSRMDNLL